MDTSSKNVPDSSATSDTGKASSLSKRRTSGVIIEDEAETEASTSHDASTRPSAASRPSNTTSKSNKSAKTTSSSSKEHITWHYSLTSPEYWEHYHHFEIPGRPFRVRLLSAMVSNLLFSDGIPHFFAQSAVTRELFNLIVELHPSTKSASIEENVKRKHSLAIIYKALCAHCLSRTSSSQAREGQDRVPPRLQESNGWSRPQCTSESVLRPFRPYGL
jgi:hypothetical protein